MLLLNPFACVGGWCDSLVGNVYFYPGAVAFPAARIRFVGAGHIFCCVNANFSVITAATSKRDREGSL